MYQISQEQLQVIANYLVSKPYSEVVGLIQMISQLELLKKEEENDKD